MKRSYIILIGLCVMMALISPVNAACPLEKKQCDQDTGNCGTDQSACAPDSCKNIKNCGNNDNCKLDKTTKCAEKKKARDLKIVKKEKCAVVNKKVCNPVETVNTGCRTDNTPGVTPTVPGDVGTTTVKMCKDQVCTVGGDGKVLSLINQNDAVDPTYAELLTFLESDKTDEIPYTSSFVCSDFAKILHDNAEANGIKAGWVGISSCNHSFNVFNTTDEGTVYIDCTGQVGGGTLLDKELNYVHGAPLTGEYLFRDGLVQMSCNAGAALVYW